MCFQNGWPQTSPSVSNIRTGQPTAARGLVLQQHSRRTTYSCRLVPWVLHNSLLGTALSLRGAVNRPRFEKWIEYRFRQTIICQSKIVPEHRPAPESASIIPEKIADCRNELGVPRRHGLRVLIESKIECAIEALLRHPIFFFLSSSAGTFILEINTLRVLL